MRTAWALSVAVVLATAGCGKPPTAPNGSIKPLITTNHPSATGCRPKPDMSATATPPDFIQIDGPHVCGEYDERVFVVNGVIFDAEQMLTCAAKIDPASIATLDLLKPAAAASLYGPRASTGAIVVTLEEGIKPPCGP
jgi:hypothetical protein